MKHQRKWLCAFLMAACFSGVAPSQEAPPAPVPEGSTPPRAAVKVAAHESRWDYPREVVPAAGQQVYFVQKGDTLWDLGKKYLGNPFAWPQIWDLNKWIKDPHWIHPGDPLLVNGDQKVVSPAGAAEAASEEIATLAPDLRRGGVKFRSEELGFSFQDFIQMPYLVKDGPSHLKNLGALSIVGRQDVTRQFLAEGERIYLEGGVNRGVKAGDRMIIVKLTKTRLFHPMDKTRLRPMGDILQQVGVARVLHVQPKASVAVIEKAMDAVEVGDHVLPYKEPASIALKLRLDIQEPVNIQAPAGRVVYLREGKVSAGAGDMVVIDQGQKDGLRMGEILLAARNRSIDAPPDLAGHAEHLGETNYYLGQVMVVHVGETTSTCRILRLKEELLLGDLLTR